MRALDLYCCDGGSAVGLQQAGFDEIVGVDILPHPEYPFDFIQADCLSLPIKDTSQFDFIWASPPCQAFSTATTPRKNGNRIRKGRVYTNLIPQTREILKQSGVPYCIENVMGAPLKKSLMLCGKMFGLKVYRHRIFEIHGFRVEQPRHPPHIWNSWKGEIFCICGETPLMPGHGYNKIKRRENRKRWKEAVFKNDITETWKEAMGIEHINNRLNLSEAIPPAYSKYIGEAALRHIDIRERVDKVSR